MFLRPCRTISRPKAIESDPTGRAAPLAYFMPSCVNLETASFRVMSLFGMWIPPGRAESVSKCLGALCEKGRNVYNIPLLKCQIKNPSADIKSRTLIKGERPGDKFVA